MKHIYKLWSILLLWAVFPLNGEAWALPVVSGESRLEAGASYYLYNAGTRSFLEHGGAWSTQATGGREGLLLKFVAVEGGLPDEYYLYDESKKRYLFATSKDSRVEDGKGVFVDGRSPFAWTVVPDGGAFRIQVSPSEEELHDAALFLGRREDRKKYPGGFYYDTPLGGSPDDIRWLLVSGEAYASYQAEASRYSEARRLADKIKEARLKGIPDGAVAEAEAVYTDTGSTEEQLTAAITALYGAGLKVFVHPGILVTRETIKRMRASIENREYPAYDGYCLLRSSTHVGEDYEMYGPYPYISRDHPDYKYTSKGMSTDFGAAYENALMWALTEEEAYAHKSMEILVAYADTLLGIPESGDRALLAGGEGFKILRALELLKHTWPGVSEEDISKVERMVKEFFIPVMEQFYDTPACTNGNWGFIVTMGYMAAAIYFDDTRMYDRACGFYLDRKDNGTIRNYVDAETGQLQESGRDQQHSMLAISAMSMICEMAHRQGDSLYALLDNRLMKGVEYVARYNMGHDVPFRTWDDVTGKYCNWTQVSPEGRGRIRGVFECAYNHYVNRLGLEMPYTAELLAANRPEGLCNESDCGSLLYYEGGAFPRDPWLGRLDIVHVTLRRPRNGGLTRAAEPRSRGMTGKCVWTWLRSPMVSGVVTYNGSTVCWPMGGVSPYWPSRCREWSPLTWLLIPTVARTARTVMANGRKRGTTSIFATCAPCRSGMATSSEMTTYGNFPSSRSRWPDWILRIIRWNGSRRSVRLRNYGIMSRAWMRPVPIVKTTVSWRTSFMSVRMARYASMLPMAAGWLPDLPREMVGSG